MEWETVFTGNIWRLQQAQHSSGKTFEKAVRSPGSRVIIIRDGKLLLSKETRHELGGRIDYRLPGGKVFDTNEEYEAFLATGSDMREASRSSIAKEALEEVGLVIPPESLSYIGTDVLGSTCEWDLYYWLCSTFTEHESGAHYQETEVDDIHGSVWLSFEDAKRIALDPTTFSESRSARMLLTYLSGVYEH